MIVELNADTKKYFRNAFREARYAALLNAEDFTPLLHTLESFGSYLYSSDSGSNNGGGLYQYEESLKSFISDLPYDKSLPTEYPVLHSEVDFLFTYVRSTRNEFAHQGVYARQKTRFILELCLIFESKLNELEMKASNYAVSGAVTAELWQPLSFIRKEMLVNSYSFIPVYYEQEWQLIADYNLALYLNEASKESKSKRKRRESETVERAIKNGLQIEKAGTVQPNTDISELKIATTKPMLVVEKDKNPERLLGLFTGFDLL